MTAEFSALLHPTGKSIWSNGNDIRWFEAEVLSAVRSVVVIKAHKAIVDVVAECLYAKLVKRTPRKLDDVDMSWVGRVVFGKGHPTE